MRWINARPSNGARLALTLAPFALVLIAYAMGSAARLADNANDKLLPGFAGFAEAINRLAFVADPRTGDYILWADTLASLLRLSAGLGISTLIALIIGLLIGMLPYVRSLLAPFVAAVSMVPPLALLPILFIVMGLGENSKIALIVIGTLPCMVRDLAMKVQELPREQIVKAQTLGGSTWQMMTHVILPQILPGLINAVRLQLGATWLFVIAAEAITAEGGLGYRVFLVRRYLAMDVILPYVIWITLLAFLIDLALRKLSARLFPWSVLKEG